MTTRKRPESGTQTQRMHLGTGTIQLHFEANVTRFADLADADKLPQRVGN